LFFRDLSADPKEFPPLRTSVPNEHAVQPAEQRGQDIVPQRGQENGHGPNYGQQQLSKDTIWSKFRQPGMQC
jgi:hypothetical protein